MNVPFPVAIYPYPDFREGGPCRPPPAPHTGMQIVTGGQGHYGNVDLERQVMGKNRERVRSCFSPRLKPPRQTRGRPQFIATERITPRAATAFKIYYAVKSHLAAARRCGTSWRGAGGPRLSRPYPRRARSEVKSRGVMREGRACRGRTRAASRSEAKSRGVMREDRACRGRTRAGPVPKRSRAASCGRAALVAAVPAPGPFRSEVARRRAGGPRLSRPHPRRARSEVKSRGVMREGRACRGRTRAGPVPK